MDYAVLKLELATDPTGLGYAAAWAEGSDWKCADALNLLRPNIDINRGVIPSYEIVNATVPGEWATLTAAEKQRFQTLTGAGQVDSANPNVRAAFQAMFAASTTTRANLMALLTRKGSRAEQLFGQAVSMNDVAQARRV